MSAQGAETPADTSDQQRKDDEVIALRSGGASFASIAKSIEVGGRLDAFNLFVDAVARRPAAEKTQLRADENNRLDALAERARRGAEGPEQAKRLASIEKLRRRLLAG